MGYMASGGAIREGKGGFALREAQSGYNVHFDHANIDIDRK